MEQTHRGNGKLIFILGIVVIVAVLSLLAQLSTVETPTLEMRSSNHADRKHDWLLAQSIVDCIMNKGPYMGMKFRDRDGKFYIPCQLSDGRIGLGIFHPDGTNLSAYIPRDGIWEQVREYILQRAFRYTGPLPW